MERAQAHRKARAAEKRRAEEIATEELEGGEINLIPYLDIVTNLMLFLLASISSGLILGHVNTTLPDGTRQNKGTSKKPPDKQDLGMFITVTRSRLQIQSTSGLVGTLAKPYRVFRPLNSPDYPDPAIRVPAPIDKRNKEAIDTWVKRCAPFTGSEQLCIDAVKADKGKLLLEPIPLYAYKKVNEALYAVAKRWKGKRRNRRTYKIVLMANADVPYGTIISLMDAMRCKLPELGKPGNACSIPAWANGPDGKPLTADKLPKGQGGKGEQCVKEVYTSKLPSGKVVQNATGRWLCGEGFACSTREDKKSGGFDRSCELYNPDKQALFSDIVFGTGIN